MLRGSCVTRFELTALAEVRQRLPVALQVLVDGVALVVGLKALQHVEEGKVLFGVLQMKTDTIRYLAKASLSVKILYL